MSFNLSANMMGSGDIELKGFRIQNYKVINDSGYCSVNEQITTLIGKNESGKTIILEGLKKFNTNIDIAREYRPESQHQFETVITAAFDIPAGIINSVFQKIGLAKRFFHSVEVEIRKHYPGVYRLSPDIKKDWNFPEKGSGLEERFLEKLLPLLPSFFFLESRDDIFPYEMALGTIEENLWHMILTGVSDFDYQNIGEHVPAGQQANSLVDWKSADIRKINIVSQPECQLFYEPFLAQFFFTRRGNRILFAVRDDKALFGIDKLNRIQRWYLSFYLKAAYALTVNSKPIFLVDEPGTLMHSHSQSRLLNKLEQFSSRYQIIFTTHSSFLINSEHLRRIRLVEKTPVDGTRIIERIYAVTDVETLTPVLTSIGVSTTAINNPQR